MSVLFFYSWYLFERWFIIDIYTFMKAVFELLFWLLFWSASLSAFNLLFSCIFFYLRKHNSRFFEDYSVNLWVFLFPCCLAMVPVRFIFICIKLQYNVLNCNKPWWMLEKVLASLLNFLANLLHSNVLSLKVNTTVVILRMDCFCKDI